MSRKFPTRLFLVFAIFAATLTALLFFWLKPHHHKSHNASQFIDSLSSPTADLQERQRRLHEIREFDSMAPSSSDPASAGTYFLGLQVFTKVILVEAEFDFLRGDFPTAVQKLCDIYYFGRIMSESPTTMCTLIGVAIRGIALRGMKDIALNCSEPGDLHNLEQALAEVTKDESPLTVSGILFDYASPQSTLFSLVNGFGNEKEIVARSHAIDAQHELLRMIIAARTFLLKQGRLPASATEIYGAMAGERPTDPFTGNPLCLIATDDEFVCYSLGPDKTDDDATYEWTASNDTFSTGDITARIPRTNPNLIPHAGLRSPDAAALRQQFPNGPLKDPFSDTRKGYSIAGSVPITLFSFGPNTDEATISKIPDYIPTIQYDPTNGLVSPGDLFTTIPLTH